MIRVCIAAALFLGNFALAAESPATEDATQPAPKSEYKVNLEVKESRLLFGLYGQMSQFARGGTSFMGYNLEGILDYAMTDRTAVQLGIAQSFDMAAGFTILYTGLRLGGAYTIFGQFMKRNSNLKVNDQETLMIETPDDPMMVVDLGVDQYLFNGTDRIVPATGISLGWRYDRNVWDYRFSLMARYGQLVIAEDPVGMLTAGVGVLMRF